MSSRIIILLTFLCTGQAFAGYMETRKVFNKLVLAIGKNSEPRPKLEIVNQDDLIAVTSSSGVITVGSRLVRLCSRFGADSNNAMASILAHELVHFYKEHFWGQSFGSAYASSEWAKKISELDTFKRLAQMHETQADELGFYYAFSAGYKTWHIVEPLLDSLYKKWYHLREDMEYYPTLTQRKAMARASAAKFVKLIPVFEMSNHLRVLSTAYQDDQQSTLLEFSGHGYEYLFKEQIQTAEMYNNIAVSKILKAQKYSSSVFARLQLPVILDQSSMMYEVSHSRGEEELEKFNQLMKSAKDNLEKALDLDNTYWPAVVNKSLILIGMENFNEAEFVLDNSDAVKAISKKDKSVAGTIAEIRAFIACSRGDSVKGRDWFKIAAKSGSSSAHRNNMVFKGRIDQLSADTEQPYMKKDTMEKWNGQIIYAAMNAFPSTYKNQVIYLNNCASLFLDSLGGFKIFELKPNVNLCPIQKVRLAISYEDGTKTSRGIGKGNTGSELIIKYGDTNLKVIGTMYSYWIYPRQNMVIMVNNGSHLVEGWFYYLVK